jgi:hypothetical protein
MSGLLIALVAAGMVAALGIVVGLIRRERRRRDSVQSFLAATSALRHMAEHPLPATGDPAPHPLGDSATVHVLDEVGDARRHPAHSPRASARARHRRPDADTIARRPTIASLPSVSPLKPLSGPGHEGRA